MSEQACRIDVWLCRARFFKTRAMAQRFVEARTVRLTRAGQESRLDKPSRAVQAEDILVFVLGSRLIAMQILALGERRGPAGEAQGLYRPV